MTEEMSPSRTRERAMAPPYVSFSTFRSLLDWLESEGVPLRYDRSFWQDKFSGSTGTQLTSALRFLGLLEHDRPLPALERLAQAPAEMRRSLLADLLVEAYGPVPFDELPRATPAMVRGWFGSYPVDGHTMRKAISFFVTAAKEAGLPLSGPVAKMARAKTSGRPGATRREAPATTGAVQSGTAGARHRPTPSQPRNQTTVALESGGSVTLTLSVDLFGLSERDREFVLRLVDLTRGYQASHRTAPSGIGTRCAAPFTRPAPVRQGLERAARTAAAPRDAAPGGTAPRSPTGARGFPAPLSRHRPWSTPWPSVPVPSAPP